MNTNRKQWVLIIGAILIVAIGFIAYGPAAPHAQANAVSDFFNNLFAPFGTNTSTVGNVASTSNAGLYQPVADYENAVVSAVQREAPSVVSITISENVPVIENCPVNPFQDLPPDFQQFFGNDFPNGVTAPCTTGKTQLQEVGGGSGFIISSDGLILTNKHVVSDTKASYTVLTNNGKTYKATVLARDPVQDLAVLKIDATGLPAVTLGDSDGIALGQTAIAIGNALGQFSNTVSVGVISGLSRTVTASGPTGAPETIEGVVQTDAAINPGNSGGPLLNLRGEVIGVNTAVASNAQNIGFAIPINRAKSAINSVKATGEIQTPFLGVRYIPLTADIASQRNLPVQQGALVQGSNGAAAVQPNSPAAQAGIQAGDIITALNGQDIDASHDLGDLVSQHNIGDVITLSINRDGKKMTVQATLAKRPTGE